MATQTTQVMASASLPALLILGWAIAATLVGFGVWKRSDRFLSAGVAAVGAMILLTPLTWYAYEASLPGAAVIGIGDVLLLGALAFLGGGTLATGLALPALRASRAAKR